MGDPVVRQKDPHAGCTLACGISVDVRVTNVRVNGDQPAAAAGPTKCTLGPGAHGPGDPHVIFKPIGPAIAVGQPTGCGGVESMGSPNVVLHGSAETSSWAQQLCDTVSDGAQATKDFIGRFFEEMARLNSTGKPDPWAEGAAKLGAGIGFLGGAIAGGTAGGAGGTLVVPGVGTLAGAATVGAAEASAGAAAGTGVGYALGVEAHALYNMMANASSSGGGPPLKFNPNNLVYGPAAKGELAALKDEAGGQLLSDFLKASGKDVYADFAGNWKAASEWALNQQLKNGGMIRFDLTNVENLEGVLNGTAFQSKVTTFELQFLKANWTRFQNNVVFYSGGKVVTPW